METYTFTPKQFFEYSELILEIHSYDRFGDVNPHYDQFLEETFGEDWLDYQLEGNGALFEYEWNHDFYYGLITGVFCEEVQQWIETEKKRISEFEQDELVNENSL
jgi:hypothetical protein